MQVVGLDDAETITARDARDVVILLESPELTVTWSRYGEGERGPDLHLHHRHTDAFYVIAGELTFDLGTGPERSVLPAGGYVAVPPDVAHSFHNARAEDARWLNFHAPDTGFAVYMRGLRDKVKTDFDSADVEAGRGRPVDEVVRGLPGTHPQLHVDARTADAERAAARPRSAARTTCSTARSSCAPPARTTAPGPTRSSPSRPAWSTRSAAGRACSPPTRRRR